MDGMSLADIQQFAKMIGDIVSNQVIGQINGVFVKIFGTVFAALVSAISFLYLSQRSDAKEAKQTLSAVIKESTKTMEAVKNELIGSEDKQKEELDTLKDINVTLHSLQETEKSILEFHKIKPETDEQK